jgi:hypothetical protein
LISSFNVSFSSQPATRFILKMAEEKAARPTMDPKLKKHAHDADEAMKAFEGIEGESIILDEETNKRLLKIIDWHMMPIMCFVYGMNYLDSTSPRIILKRHGKH